MKVVYDISVLGSGVLDPKARTGVFRVVENLARELVASDQCEVQFCAGGSTLHPMYGALQYLAGTPEFESTQFLSMTPRARLYSWLLRHLTKSSKRQNITGGSGILRRAKHSLRGRATGLIASRPFPLDAETIRGADIFHSPYPALPTWPEGVARKRFLTVYDLIAVKRPELYEPHVERHDRAILDSIQPGDYVTCISEATRAELCEYTGISPDRVFVTPLAASRELFHKCSDPERIRSTLHGYGLPEAQYLLALGTLKPGKNFATTIRAFAQLVEGERIKELNLVLVGVEGWNYASIFDTVRELESVRGRIHFTGYVADEDLAALYSGAMAFVFPSFYEGFGLPVLEAMQCGVPVVASNSSAIPEVVGDAGILVNPTDLAGFSDALLSLYRDPARRLEYSKKAQVRAESFSWERCAAATIAAYRTALAD